MTNTPKFLSTDDAKFINGNWYAIGQDYYGNGAIVLNHHLLAIDNIPALVNMLVGDVKELEFISPNHSIKSPMRYTQIVTRIK